MTEEIRAQELCESRGGCPGLPVPNSPLGSCVRKATLEEEEEEEEACILRAQKLCESRGGRLTVLTVSVDVKQR